MNPLTPYKDIVPFPVSPGRDRVIDPALFRWAPGEVDGRAYRWLTPGRWNAAANLPPPDESGFVWTRAFVHERSGSLAVLLYNRAGFRFDPSDFLETVKGPRFTHGTAYIRDRVAVAERVGSTPDGRTVAVAVHVSHPSVYMIRVHAPATRDAIQIERLRAVVNEVELAPEQGEPSEPEDASHVGFDDLVTKLPVGSSREITSGVWRARVPLGGDICNMSLRVVAKPPAAANEAAFVGSAASDTASKGGFRNIRRGSIRASRNLLRTPMNVLCGEISQKREIAVAWWARDERSAFVFAADYPSMTERVASWLGARFVARRTVSAMTRLTEE